MISSNTLFLDSYERTSNIEPDRAFTRFSIFSSNCLKHHFYIIELTQMCSSFSNRTQTPYRTSNVVFDPSLEFSRLLFNAACDQIQSQARDFISSFKSNFICYKMKISFNQTFIYSSISSLDPLISSFINSFIHFFIHSLHLFIPDFTP